MAACERINKFPNLFFQRETANFLTRGEYCFQKKPEAGSRKPERSFKAVKNTKRLSGFRLLKSPRAGISRAKPLAGICLKNEKKEHPLGTNRESNA
jgi:hypothetical protein